MRRRSPYEEDYEFDDRDENEPKRRVKHFRKDRDEDRKKHWDRESHYDTDQDYDDRR